jgi:hypothetical protein
MAEEPGKSVPKGSAVMPLIPEELGVHPLLLVVLHATVFLDGSEDDVIDPDAAVEALEYMATYLQRLSGPDLRRVKEDIQALASFGNQEGWPKKNVRFFKEFLDNFGVAEEEKA